MKTLRILTAVSQERRTDTKTYSELRKDVKNARQCDRHTDDERWLNSVIKLVNTKLNNSNLKSNNCLYTRNSKNNNTIIYANKLDNQNNEKNLNNWIAKTAKIKETIFVPDIIPEPEDNHNKTKEIYSNNDGSVQANAQIPDTNMHIFTVDFKNEYQTDMGANISATNNKSILHNFKEIPPRPVSGISSNETQCETKVHITGYGSLYLISSDGIKLHINVHYGEQINGTILSPTAITKQHISRFNGYILEADMDKQTGYLRLISRHRNYTLDFQLTSHNDLWFHTKVGTKMSNHNVTSPDTNKDNKGSVMNVLSDAAQYELWHQRCAHRGKRTLSILHKHTTGVPHLKGNEFWKCPSCLPGKLAIKIDHSKKNRQNTENKIIQDDITIHKSFP